MNNTGETAIASWPKKQIIQTHGDQIIIKDLKSFIYWLRYFHDQCLDIASKLSDILCCLDETSTTKWRMVSSSSCFYDRFTVHWSSWIYICLHC